MPDCSVCTCMLVCASSAHLCTRDRGCSKHPAFPAPSFFRGTRFMQTLGLLGREIAESCSAIAPGSLPSLKFRRAGITKPRRSRHPGSSIPEASAIAAIGRRSLDTRPARRYDNMTTIAERTTGPQPPVATRIKLSPALSPLTDAERTKQHIQASHENPHAAFPAGGDRGRLARGGG
jgi:hypothetical protein